MSQTSRVRACTHAAQRTRDHAEVRASTHPTGRFEQ